MEARSVLDKALVLTELRGEISIGLWSRAATLLGRQALELTLLEFWQRVGLELGECAIRAQLLCLGETLRDQPLAQEVSHTWYALTRACHHQTYGLSPTDGEVRHWLSVVEQFIGAVSQTGQESKEP